MKVLVVLAVAGGLLWAVGAVTRSPDVKTWQRERSDALACKVAVMNDRWDVAERRCPR